MMLSKKEQGEKRWKCVWLFNKYTHRSSRYRRTDCSVKAETIYEITGPARRRRRLFVAAVARSWKASQHREESIVSTSARVSSSQLARMLQELGGSVGCLKSDYSKNPLRFVVFLCFRCSGFLCS